MVLNTLTVGAAVTPSVIETAISHYIKRAPLRGKPTAHISYDEGLHLVRQFLDYASNHTVDEVQSFTAQWVPCPRWVKATDILIPESHLSHAATLLSTQLGPSGLKLVGGSQWWQWRPGQTPLKAEWIEMRADYNERKAKSLPAQRIILYIHGGAYYFGSIDEHRYQLQRHARKLKARLLAPRYRLAPQFPFPCGLQDALASYLHLLTEYDPSSILLMGDSAGAGMVLSVLVTLRDQGVPLPAGAVLISPWVDLTHSFPSVSGEGKLDYIPAHGFHHRPSVAWPPPNEEEQRDLRKQADLAKDKTAAKNKEEEAVTGTKVQPEHPDMPEHREPAPNPPALSINLDGKHITLIDQIQIYAANTLLSHPLVSPALQPSLGGLPPLLIQVGGGELLRDEQVYIAHKAANPSHYPAPDVILDLYDPERKQGSKYPPTKVQLQVWEDLCHVPHTLSFTRPAKYMYRAVAQFGNHIFSQSVPSSNAFSNRASRIPKDDDAISIISTSTSASSSSDEETLHSKKRRSRAGSKSSNTSGKGRSLSEGDVASARIQATTTITGGDWASTASALASLPADQDRTTLPSVSATSPIPSFDANMIRQLIDRHGTIFPLPPATQIPALNLATETIGTIKPGPVRKWLARKAQWDHKFSSTKRKVQTKRLEEMRKGFAKFTASDGTVEVPPPTALAGRQFKLKPDSQGQKMGKMGEGLRNLEAAGKGKKKSWGLAMWSGWGSKHDEATIEAGSGVGAAAVVGAAGASVGGSQGQTLAREERAGRGKEGEGDGKERSRSVGASLRNPLRKALSRRSSRSSAKGDERTEEVVPPVPALPADVDARGRSSDTKDVGGDLKAKSSAISGTTQGDEAEKEGRSSTAAASAAAATVAAVTAGGIAHAAHDDSKAETQQTKAEEEMMAAALPKGDKAEGSENTFLAPGNTRPHNGIVAYPFKLRGEGGHERSASTMTLESVRSGIAEDLNEKEASEEAVPNATEKTEVDGAVESKAKAANGLGRETHEGTETGKAVVTGEVLSEKQRPKLETFVTANEF
ncbi:Alpha/beta hydrolase fold-containing protein 3 [Elsinoe fawcettii]|nr:Alpha/beta hydrolase fold-containing protein 3 [Elsinoe fawcettii]